MVFLCKKLAEVALHDVEIMERFYDCETGDFGNKKPNKSLGKFLMSDEWEKKLFEDYNCNTYGHLIVTGKQIGRAHV